MFGRLVLAATLALALHASTGLAAIAEPTSDTQMHATASAAGRSLMGRVVLASTISQRVPQFLPKSQSDGQGSTFTVGQIEEFTQTAGQPQWAAEASRNISQAAWTFDGTGAFVFDMPNMRTDIYPMHGRYTNSGPVTTFSARAGTSAPTGQVQASVDGTINFSASPPIMTIEWDTSTVNAAVVNGQSFGSNSGSGYRALLTLRAAQ